MEVEEPTMLEYARFHHLASDYRALHPLSSNGMPPPPENFLLGLADPDGATDLSLPSEFCEVERLSFGKDEAIFLHSIIVEPEEPALVEWCSLDHRRHQKRRLELPLLRTDHELDVREFGQRIIPDFRRLNLPFEKVEEEDDEGLSWPKSTYRLPKDLLSKEEKGKLQYSREAFLCLSTIIKDARTQDQNSYTLDTPPGRRKKSAIGPATPPLLPLSPAMSPFIPSSPVGRLELLSDLPSSTDQRMKDIDDMLMAQDRIGSPPPTVSKGGSQMCDSMLLDEDQLGQIYSPLRGANEEISYSSPSRRVRPSDRKVEGPLTPPMTVAPQNARIKSLSFPEIVQEVIPDLPPPIEKRPDELSPQADLDTFFKGTIAPIAEKVNSALEQEQLQEKDSTLRVDVPIVDFSLPTPPWGKYSRISSRQGLEEQTDQKAQERLLIEIKERHLNLKTHLWSGASRVERELYWTPFPADLGKVALEEAIDGDDDGGGETVATFLADFHQKDIIDSSSLTWKPGGLRILRDNDEDTDEEGLQPGTFSEEHDIVSMIKKRKLELQENTLDSPPEERRQDKAPKMDFTHPSLLSGTFSAFNQLSNFVEIRSGLSKTKKLTESPHFPTKAPEPTTRAASSTEKKPGPATAERTKSPTQPTRPPLSVPRTPAPTTSHPFIISSTLLMQKTLTRRIETLYPSAELIERDWTAHTPTPPRGTSKPSKSPPPDPLNDEADLLLSPSTGLILITLQKLKQRPLPGQVQRSAIRERIARVAPRYERLVVFVSEGRSIGDDSGTAGMMGDDCEAVLEFMGFAASLKDEVEVRYIAGGEEELAAWVVGYMVKYGGTDGEVRLIQDETLWELFLRRAGMNAYAAQVVLSELKAPDEDQTKQEGQSQQADFGLTKFVKMGVGKRLKMFERFLGGKKVLLKVSRNLDARWQ